MSKNELDYKIESGIPVPEAHNGHKRLGKYPFRKMKPGDSFVFAEKYTQRAHSLASANAIAFCKSANKKWTFTTRRTKDNKVRIWRIK